MQDTGSGADEGLFASIEPCPIFLDILTDTPSPDSPLGNFTQAPTEREMRECVETHSLYLLNGDALAEALRQPAPSLKVRSSLRVDCECEA